MTPLACRSFFTLIAAAVLTGLSAVAAAQAPPPNPVPVERRPGITGQRLKELAHEHEGLGALAPQNLAKKRPKPPFDLTSTWFVDLTRAFADFRFGEFHVANLEFRQRLPLCFRRCAMDDFQAGAFEAHSNADDRVVIGHPTENPPGVCHLFSHISGEGVHPLDFWEETVGLAIYC